MGLGFTSEPASPLRAELPLHVRGRAGEGVTDPRPWSWGGASGTRSPAQVCGGGHPGAVGGPGDTSRQWQQEAPGLGQVGCSLTPWLEAGPEGQGLPVLFSPHSSCPRPLGWPPSLWPFPRWTPLSLEQQARREHRAGHTPSHKGRSLEPANGPHLPRLPSHTRWLLGADGNPVLSAGTGYGVGGPGVGQGAPRVCGHLSQAALCQQPPGVTSPPTPCPTPRLWWVTEVPRCSVPG